VTPKQEAHHALKAVDFWDDLMLDSPQATTPTSRPDDPTQLENWRYELFNRISGLVAGLQHLCEQECAEWSWTSLLNQADEYHKEDTQSQ
jgi:hypothetical protein